MTDKKVVLAVVIGLVGTVLGSVVGSIILAFDNTTLPADVGDLAKVALGALGALLARTSSEPNPTIEVKSPSVVVEQPPQSPQPLGGTVIKGNVVKY